MQKKHEHQCIDCGKWFEPPNQQSRREKCDECAIKNMLGGKKLGEQNLKSLKNRG